MKYKINQAAEVAGVTVKTLRHYETIGLLTPARSGQNGYRLYDEDDMLRLQQILFFRELEFPLAEIKAIMDSPGFDRQKALESQLQLLTARRRRLEGIIALAEKSLKGEQSMSFKEFDMKEIEAHRDKYKEEIISRWGGTAAYGQSRIREEGYQQEDWNRLAMEMEELIKEFAQMRRTDPKSPQAQQLVGKWQGFISDNYYDCTPEILSGLGQMYVGDERFKETFDKHGDGTAEFASQAIAAYCQKKQ